MNRRIKNSCVVISILVVVFLLTGCNFSIGYVNNSSTKKASASFVLLSASEEKIIKLESEDTITFDYELEEKKGELSATFIDSSGDIVYEFEPNTKGKIDLYIEEDDSYKLIIKGDKAKGSYKFEWTIE